MMTIEITTYDKNFLLSRRYINSMLKRKTRKVIFGLKLWNYRRKTRTKENHCEEIRRPKCKCTNFYSDKSQVISNNSQQKNHQKIKRNKTQTPRANFKKSSKKYCNSQQSNSGSLVPQAALLSAEPPSQLLRGENNKDYISSNQETTTQKKEAMSQQLTTEVNYTQDTSTLKNYRVIQSPADGHCLLHSIVTSLHKQISIHQLINYITVEFYSKLQEYQQFCPDNDIVTQFNNYIEHKIYNTAVGDIIPLLVSNSIKHPISIYDEHLKLMCIVNPLNVPLKHSLRIRLHNEHYDALLKTKLRFSRAREKMVPEHSLHHQTIKTSPPPPRSTSELPSAYIINVASLAKPHALEHLKTDVGAYNTDLVFISETHLKNKHEDKLFEIENYTLFRRDRVKRKGGGVACYIKNNLEANIWKIENEPRDYEILWIKIKEKESTIFAGSIYHPPKPNYKEEELINYLEKTITDIKIQYPNADFIVAGDINRLPKDIISERTGLVPLIRDPTRGANTLDQIFTSKSYPRVQIIDPTSITDHKAILVTSKSSSQTTKKLKRTITYRPSTPKQRCNFLQNSENYKFTLSETKELQTMSQEFYAKSIEILNFFFPERTTTVTSKDPHFITPTIKTLLRKKNKLMKAGKAEEANGITKTIQKLIINKNKNFLADIDLKKDSKKAWKKIKSFQKQQTKQCTIDVEELNQHYARISTDKEYTEPCKKLTSIHGENVEFFTRENIQKALNNLKHTASGPDGLPWWFLKIASPILAEPLTTLINQSINKQEVPKQWKLACITPVPKTTSPQQPSDYRPISLTAILSRITEKLIVKHYINLALQDPTCAEKLKNQFAFQPSGSTTAAIVALLHEVTEILERTQVAVVIALDFSKAFDTVRHSTLFENLATISIKDNMYNWLVDYYSEHEHYTKINQNQSKRKKINASVIQGSAIGPTAFIIATMELKPLNSENKIIQYADDTYLILPGYNESQREKEIENIRTWAQRYNLCLNERKSNEIIVTRSHNRTDIPTIKTIPRSSELKVLGITIDDRLAVTKHVTNTILTCNKIMYFLKSLKAHGLSPKKLQSLFVPLITSRFIYASQAWWGYTNKSDRERLESYLKRAKKWHFCDSKSTVTEVVTLQDKSYYGKIECNKEHKLNFLLPRIKSTRYYLREPQRYLPVANSWSFKNFLTRMNYSPQYVNQIN